MNIVWVGIGSNLGDRESHIISAMGALDNLLEDLERAPLYETAPRDYEEQDDFLNTVARGRTSLDPFDFLARTQRIELEGGRMRSEILKGPRTIDIDILLWNDFIIDREAQGMRLTVPHPSMHERLFVLKPLLDLNPDASDPRDNVLWSLKASRLESQRVMLYRK